MESKKNKTEIVKMLLNSNLDTKDQEELLDLLIDQPISIDVDKLEESKLTKGDRLADRLSEVAGSWTFIIVFCLFLLGWIILNGILLTKDNAIDPYPFILLNLLLSCLAAIQAPIIMMSQNRQAAKDSLRNQNDYRTDLKSELILEELHDKIEKLEEDNKRILELLEKEGKKHEK